MIAEAVKPEHRLILDLVGPGSSVLDLGCGDGTLLSLLVREKQVKAQGIEVDESAIYKCVARGLSVFHGDIDTGLPDYGNKSFDYVIIDQSLQQVRKPDRVLVEALRVGREVIVAFPNFAHWPARMQIFFRGRTPVTPSLPYAWHDTPNLHFLSIADFTAFCRHRSITMTQRIYVNSRSTVTLFPNIRAETGIFLLTGNAAD